MKRVKIALLVLAVALVSLIVWRVAQPPNEPVYQGKPLSEWLGIMDVNELQAVNDAVRHIGTNAIPALLRFLRTRDSSLKVKLMALARRQHIIRIQYTPAVEWNSRGNLGFSILGTNGQSAVPELIEIADENISPDSQFYAIGSLGCIGPAAKEAVPSLLRWATNANLLGRTTAIHVLRDIDPEAAAKAGITNAP